MPSLLGGVGGASSCQSTQAPPRPHTNPPSLRAPQLPPWSFPQAARLILSQVSHAYGLMILGEGLFQADGHPGNILVQQGGRVALLDYGQSKQLEERDKLAFADLILAMNR